MKILVFEYSTVICKKHLISEGLNMLKSILSDLNKIKEYDVDYLINEELKTENYFNCNAVYINTEPEKWLEKNCEEYDCCIFIAPEDDLILYEITKILEKHEVNVIGSKSSASYICSSKNRTYETLPSIITKIPSIKINIDDVDYRYITEFLNKYNVIIKPDDRTSSDLIYHITNMTDLKNIIQKYKKESVKTALLQKYILGQSVSVSAICNREYINCISINSQEILDKKQITYIGCKTPITHPLKKEIICLSMEIIKNIEGLCGFVGIDYIIHENKIYFVEINSRITTPYIILHETVNVNLTQTLIELVLHNKRKKIRINKKGTFYKQEYYS